MINIVYDVLNNLNACVYERVGCVPASKFNISECVEYTEEEKQAIYDSFGSAEVFRGLSAVPGASEICEIEKTGKALVWINSSNFTQEIADIKREWLFKYIPNLSEERVLLHVGHGEKKVSLDFADIVVEDCFKNLLKYDSHVVKILIDKTHNKAETYGTTDEKEHIIRVNSLLEANVFIKSIVKG